MFVPNTHEGENTPKKMVICSEEQDFNLMLMEGKSLFSSLSREMLTFSRLNVHGSFVKSSYIKGGLRVILFDYGFLILPFPPVLQGRSQ